MEVVIVKLLGFFWASIEYGDSNTSRNCSSAGCILTTFEIVILLVISIILVKVLELLITIVWVV